MKPDELIIGHMYQPVINLFKANGKMLCGIGTGLFYEAEVKGYPSRVFQFRTNIMKRVVQLTEHQVTYLQVVND